MSFRPSATRVTGAPCGACRKREAPEWLKAAQLRSSPHWLRLGHESHRAPKWRRKPLKSHDSRPEMAAGRETGGGRACGPLVAALSSRRGRDAGKWRRKALEYLDSRPKLAPPAETTG